VGIRDSETCRFRLQNRDLHIEDADDMFLRNDGNHLLDYTVPQSRQTTVITAMFNDPASSKDVWFLVPEAKIGSAN
jgi:hypothetical protein